MNHANRGKAWEQTLEMYHARYEAQGRAVVIRTPPPMRILRSIKPGQFVAVYESAGPPDYMALSEGTAFLLEAKQCHGERWALKNLHAHQGLRLDDWEKQGGKGAVLLQHVPSSSAWVLPWSKLGPVWHRWFDRQQSGKRATPGTASIQRADFLAIGRPFARDGWLSQAMRK